MPAYQPGIPTGTVNLDVDYQNIRGNFEQANIVYGTDHYPFDNATPNQGFHNLVTTPPVVNNPPNGLPPATAANPKFYAYQQYPALGVLHYSRGPSNAVPTTLTKLNSTAAATVIAPATNINILDFTGMTFGYCLLYASNLTNVSQTTNVAFVVWDGAAVNIRLLTPVSAILVVQSTGNILQLRNASAGALNNVYWSLEIIRIQ